MTDDELFQELISPVKAPVPLNVDTVLSANRISICRKCPMLQNFACTECGCSVFTKARKEQESCPIGKW
jgi:hypothetical protein